MGEESTKKMAFSLLDYDNDNQISVKDFMKVVHALGLKKTRKEVEELMITANIIAAQNSLENNNNNNNNKEGGTAPKNKLKIDENCFNAVMSSPIHKDDISRAFKILDKDHSGYISIIDLSQILELFPGSTASWTEQEFEEMMEKAEVKDQLKIEFEQYKKWWE